jgi:cephalosporin-C deacetylase-like acetyl esterase
MRIAHHVYLVTLLIALAFGAVYAQPSTFDQLALLYNYEKSTPLELEQKDVDDRNGVKIHWVSFAVTKGNRADGILVVPQNGNKRRPGIIWMHSGGPFFWFSDALLMAQAGAISLIVSPKFGSPDLPAEQYRDAMIGAVISIRRAVDILESRPDVDSGKIGYVGHSFGALMGAVAAAVDKRFKAAVFEVGLPGMSYHLRSSPIGWAADHRRSLGAQLESYLKVISPVDAIHYVGRLSPTTLLFQSARLDPGVPEKDSLEFYNAASEPKQLKWYDATHEVTDIEAISDRARFLAKELKLSSIDPVLRKKTGLK